MSLQSFQSALAYVLRSFNAEHKKNLDDLLLMYELTSEEKFTLQDLINQQQLRSYSEELFLARWTIIREGLEFLHPLVDMKALSDLWEKQFDPKSNAVVQEDLVLKFLEYLVNDPIGSRFINTGTQAFLPSLIRYLHAVFTFKHNRLPTHVLAADTTLTERFFMIINLEYDVREFFAELIELKDFRNFSLKSPPKNDISLLFVASDTATEFRSFEVDQQLVDFLTAELKGEKRPTIFPSCYGDLVDLGLCKPIGLNIF